jgi:hypothetical protein
MSISHYENNLARTPDNVQQRRYCAEMTKQTFDSFEEFWPYYVAMHSKAATRWVHLGGTLTGLAVTGYGLARGRARYAAALPLIGYGTAWPAQSKSRIKPPLPSMHTHTASRVVEQYPHPPRTYESDHGSGRGLCAAQPSR